jgi:N-terminal acetyltransferase B complex catalytic subunit
MTTVRPFTVDDLFRFNNVNLDSRLTETYNMKFYLSYLVQWPELFLALESPTGMIMSYLIGKVEGKDTDWHGHVTAITVSPQFRRLGFARRLMHHLERVSEERKCYFVDLFVRHSNSLAIGMYEQLGYSKYRRILSYYSGDPPEDGLDMRKSLLTMDPEGKKMIPLPHPVHCDELEYN